MMEAFNKLKSWHQEFEKGDGYEYYKSHNGLADDWLNKTSFGRDSETPRAGMQGAGAQQPGDCIDVDSVWKTEAERI